MQDIGYCVSGVCVTPDISTLAALFVQLQQMARLRAQGDGSEWKASKWAQTVLVLG